MQAQYPGTCTVCRTRYLPKTEIKRYGSKWGHEVCVDNQMETNRIRSGETYRSQKKSDYRRKVRRR